MNTIISPGIRAGRTFAFCKAMGWSLRPYQMLLLLRVSYSNAYRKFMPPKPFNFEKWWQETHPKKTWHTVWIEEAYFDHRP